MKHILSSVLALLVFCVPAIAQDKDVMNLLSGATEEANSLSDLSSALASGSSEEMQVLFRRIAELGEKRPDLVDHVISAGLRSEDPVLRHQALWLVVSRSKALSIVIDLDKSDSKKAKILDKVGGVIPLALFQTLEARRSIHLKQSETDGDGDRFLQVIGANVHFKNYGDDGRWSLQGSLALTKDGSALEGKLDYGYQGSFWNVLSMTGSIALE